MSELDDAVARLAALPRSKTLPGCMAPDGGDCCPEYHALSEENCRMRTVLLEAELQIDYLHKKFQETGTGNATLARIRDVLGIHR